MRLEARVVGEVQGVGFRYWTMRQAQRLGLSGEVANRVDGSVAIVAEGPPSAIDGLLELLQAPGTPGSVRYVEHGTGPAKGSFSDFRAH